ncbi:YdgA family protein [Plesiomonas shigelloides]|uniref:DUF945 family protein n=1 Tax=Plesiomonas shigelloides TaxID=703 RepID=UPI00351CE781
MAQVKGRVIGLGIVALAVAAGLQYYTGSVFDQQLQQVKADLSPQSGVTITETARSFFSRQIDVKVVTESGDPSVQAAEILAKNAVSIWPLHISATTTLASQGLVAELEKLSGKPLPFAMHSSYTLGSDVKSNFTLGELKLTDEGNQFLIKPLTGDLTYNVNQRELDLKTDWQGGDLKSNQETELQVDAVSILTKQQQKQGLWFGTNTFDIASFSSETAASQVTFSNLKIDTDQQEKGEGLDFISQITLGDYQQTKPLLLNVKDALLKFQVTGLNRDALLVMSKQQKISEEQAQNELLQLLGKGVKVSIDQLSAKIGEGMLQGKGVMQLPADRAMPSNWDELLLPLTADAQLSVDEKVFLKQPQMLLMLLQLSSQGWISQKDGQLHSSVTIHDGMLSVNGNEVSQLF